MLIEKNETFLAILHVYPGNFKGTRREFMARLDAAMEYLRKNLSMRKRGQTYILQEHVPDAHK